jgi:hypothetical protein
MSATQNHPGNTQLQSLGTTTTDLANLQVIRAGIITASCDAATR